MLKLDADVVVTRRSQECEHGSRVDAASSRLAAIWAFRVSGQGTQLPSHCEECHTNARWHADAVEDFQQAALERTFFAAQRASSGACGEGATSLVTVLLLVVSVRAWHISPSVGLVYILRSHLDDWVSLPFSSALDRHSRLVGDTEAEAGRVAV